jgi:hypothetical protein
LRIRDDCRADVELLYDRPYEDKSKVRVAGPFTVESLSPHRVNSTSPLIVQSTVFSVFRERRS